MRRGFKIFDSDTHLNPMVETLEPYFDPAMRQRMPACHPSVPCVDTSLKIVFALIAAEAPLSPSPPAMVQRFDLGIAERV
jgi:hypothetical protein